MLRKRTSQCYFLRSGRKVTAADRHSQQLTHNNTKVAANFDYYDYNLMYLNVAVGKGLTSWDIVQAVSDYCETYVNQ